MIDISRLREAYDKEVAKRDFLLDRKKLIENDLSVCRKDLQGAIGAVEHIQKVSKLTMEEIKHKVSDLVSIAFETIFPNPYKFEIDFVSKRNKTECDLYVVRPNGTKIHPLDGSGGGIADVCGFALRVTYWTLRNDLRNIFILDETFKFVSEEYRSFCAEFLKKVSYELGVQIIMVSHLQEIMYKADTVYKLTNDGVKASISRMN